MKPRRPTDRRKTTPFETAIVAEQQRRQTLVQNLTPFDHALERDGTPGLARYWCELCVGYYGVNHQEQGTHRYWPECKFAHRTQGKQKCACISCLITARTLAGELARSLTTGGASPHDVVLAALGWRREPRSDSRLPWVSPTGNRHSVPVRPTEGELLAWLEAQPAHRTDNESKPGPNRVTINYQTGKVTLQTSGPKPLKVEATTLHQALSDAVYSIVSNPQH